VASFIYLQTKNDYLKMAAYTAALQQCVQGLKHQKQKQLTVPCT